MGPVKRSWRSVRSLKSRSPTDAVVKIFKTTICGTDLHILKGDVARVSPGRILGHEGVGMVEKTGPGVTLFSMAIASSSPAFRHAANANIADVACTRTALPVAGYWATRSTERRPNMCGSRTPIPASIRFPTALDEEALVMLSDILPTGFECGVLNGKVEPGSTVAIVGAGPIGLAALLTAQFYSPAEIIMIDLDENRLQVSKRFGATATVNATDGKASAAVMEMTGGRGVDTAIEAVGVPASFITCEEIVAPGGTIANVGVHGPKWTFTSSACGRGTSRSPPAWSTP